jgi:hypothetical protein
MALKQLQRASSPCSALVALAALTDMGHAL